MHFEAAMHAFGLFHKQMGPMLDGMLLLFFRILAFVVTGPIFNRKNMPFMFKISVAFFLTGTLFWMIPPDRNGLPPGYDAQFLLLPIALNVVIGSTLGFIANMLLETISAAGGLMNNQVGLSSAALMDPSSGRQTMVLESLMGYIGTLLFIDIDGVQWMIMALKRSVDIVPLVVTRFDVAQVFSIPYLVQVSGTVLLVGVILVAPVMIVTIAIDVMLGIVNRTAQQIPVFQLSAALKPSIGVAVMLLTLSTFIKAAADFLNDYSRLF
jgi:flagellar biosynthetic protein FliR